MSLFLQLLKGRLGTRGAGLFLDGCLHDSLDGLIAATRNSSPTIVVVAIISAVAIVSVVVAIISVVVAIISAVTVVSVVVTVVSAVAIVSVVVAIVSAVAIAVV